MIYVLLAIFILTVSFSKRVLPLLQLLSSTKLPCTISYFKPLLEEVFNHLNLLYWSVTTQHYFREVNSSAYLLPKEDLILSSLRF